MEHIRGTTNQGHSGSIPTCAEDFCNRSEQARRAIEDFKQTPQAYSVLQFRLRVGSTPVVDEFIREAIFGMERALPSGNSLGENMGVLGPVCRCAEAWNCTETDALCFYSLPYSHKKFEQAQGRIDRINTPFTDLYYYVLMSDAPVERGIWKAIQEQKNFDEQRFISQEKDGL